MVELHRDGSETQWPFSSDVFKIGRDRACDLKTGGWIFAPRVAAEIERGRDGYRLVPHRGGKVVLKQQRIHSPELLLDGDEFSVRGTAMRFVHRVSG
ncbi:MAG TPA: FHA domain-containing protein [Lamprocystis sp. (in: g-proteobacteria)]|nr:FHA domain-containing protein [Lamprocystis sp. (in: g-proteobacteria)]